MSYDAIYDHAYFIYNISMVVNYTTSRLDQIRKILREQNGILFTSDLVKPRIPRTYLAILEKNGEIQRVSRGVYFSQNSIVDEMVSIQARYKRAIFSHETALYLHGLTDRTPLDYSVTVPAGYNATLLKAEGAKVFFVNHSLYMLGLIAKASPHGNEIKTFDLERTICDVVRNRNQIDVQIKNEALKRYVVSKERRFDLLYSYAKKFRIEKIVREYIEILR